MTEPMNAEAVAQPRRVYIDRSMVFDAGVTWTTVAGLYPHAYVPEEAYLAIAAENATLRAERDSYEASAVDAHRVSRAHQSDAVLWQYSAAVGDVPPLLVTVWKQRKAAEAELATLRASEAAAREALAEIGVAVAALEGADSLDKEIIRNIGARLAALTALETP